MTDIQKGLFSMQDKKYAEFQAKLTPTVDKSFFIGVRVPKLRQYASDLIKSKNYSRFLDELPHKYYDENLLHSILISKIKDYSEALERIEEFLPYIDNWAVSDTLSPGIFKKHKPELIIKIKEWAKSPETYTCRFGIDMLMTHFLDEDFKPEYLKIPARIKSDEYYVNMMLAWFFATALAKQWDETVPYIENSVLPKWVHNKTITKSVESYRITEEQKTYLKQLRI